MTDTLLVIITIATSRYRRHETAKRNKYVEIFFIASMYDHVTHNCRLYQRGNLILGRRIFDLATRVHLVRREAEQVSEQGIICHII